MTQNQTISPTIAIVGLGYVGLPLAIAFSKRYTVIGFDINEERVRDLENGKDYTLECTEAAINNAKNLQFTSSITSIKEAGIYIVTVPTPVDVDKRPNLKPLLEASAMIGSVLKKGDIVIYESTVYPGCTEEDCVPILEKQSGLVFNKDFYVGYSPERINPGDKVNTLTTIKKLTAGSTPEIASKVDALYASIITAGTFKVSSIKVAEAAKSIENAQRDINISFVNELALIFDRIGIDTHEVLEAAATKWNFLPFKPGLVGGHCIGVDPYYLAHKATSLGYHPQVILSGRNVNDQMGTFVTEKLIQLLNTNGFAVKGAKALLLGVSFKENCPDIRNSKAFEIFKQLRTAGLEVDAFDPYANAIEVKQKHAIDLVNALGKYDVIILVVAHDFFKSLDYASLKRSDKTIIYDTKAFLDRSIVTARL
ncbi:MAG: nucleotide sugar dehydrogenase [Chitinophagia bacterium]|jgi:UDP-N-acetyl-D-galactosamine dehydrogenase|nr:nucleotide sugar dehydrogenase [Chitinophagia bacterium]NCA29554.1 nucleotide sugar dehydrogenase [Chitinophagia bacterium]NDD16612.1 nucleotide sugar dehydrogenase [Chitinophagia bacterium]